MFERDNNEIKWFSVVRKVVMGGVRFLPQVCYRLTPDLRAVIENLVEKGLAITHAVEVRFISGMPVPIAKPRVNRRQAFFDRLPSAPEGVPASSTEETNKGKTKKVKEKEFE